MLTVAEAVVGHRGCACDCHRTLTLDERIAGIRAVYRLDDALRGWGYVPLYDVHGDRLWREARQKADPNYRKVAVRFGECIYRRLVGSLLHECLHAVVGDVAKANYGIAFGLPYGVPVDVEPAAEEAYLEPFNFAEARAWVGVWIVGRKMFGIDWDLRTARDIGTYGFVGGNALVAVPPGFRPVGHIDRNHHAERYYVRGRKLEERAREWFSTNLDDVVQAIDAAADVGAKKRPRANPAPELVAKTAPKAPGRNEPCVCGSGEKFKECCSARGAFGYLAPSLSR